MGQAYTPGLLITEGIDIKKNRILPLKGEVIVKKGDILKADAEVARAFLPGNVTALNVAGKLGIPPEDLEELMTVKEGDKIKKDDPIAISKGFFGFFKQIIPSPIIGSVESISSITGQVLLRELPIPVSIKAYIDGEVIDIIEKEGVVMHAQGAFVQGIFGIGGETNGEIKVLATTPDEILNPDKIDESCKGKVIIIGALMSKQLIDKAISVGCKGVVAGGLHDTDLKSILKYDLGVAITGHEDIATTLIVTEGFGEMKIADITFELLKKFEGKTVSINGATQIRAGVMRPEIIIPLTDKEFAAAKKLDSSKLGLVKGTPVRIIRAPYFGVIGAVEELPPELTKIESETKARIVTIKLDDGKIVSVPRANIEIIEE